MKALFAHDHRFLLRSDGVAFSKGKVNPEMFDIYLNFLDSITIVSRFEKIDSASDNLVQINNSNLSFYPFKNLSNVKELFNNRNISEMCDLVSQHDFVIARLPSEIGLLAVNAANRVGVKCIIEFVACPWDGLWYYGGIKSKLYAPYYFYRNRKAVKNASDVIYVTSDFLQKRYPNNFHNIGVSDVSITDVNLNPKTIATDDKIILGLVGSLDSPHKGIELAIKAIIDLREQGYNATLKILGPGDKSRWVTKFPHTTDYVEYSGVLPPGEAVRSWLSSLDIYIQPSYQEGLPRAIIEAMSTGLPVVGSDAGGIPELIMPDYVHKRGDYLSLVKNIKLIIELDRYKKASEYSLDKANEFKLDNLIQRRMSFWSKALGI